jgi:hypothetical protein
MPDPPDHSLPIGALVGAYVVEAQIGSGGMARVYRVRHGVLGTLHALKVLEPEFRALAEGRDRFRDEALIQSKRLVHPNIVKVTDIIVTDQVAGLLMEFVDGPSLDDHIARLNRPAQPQEIRALMLPILSAVGHAHSQGIVHRDVKPANILLARGADGEWIPKVTDFGIAKVMHDAPGGRAGKKSTSANARLGTPGYMSPEQIRTPKQVTERSDVFSLGAVLYELATGAAAFEDENDFEVELKIVTGTCEPPERRVPGLDPVIGAAIRRALAPDPALRFASCEELAAALTRPAPISTPAPRPTADRKRWPRAIAAGAGLAGLAVAVAWFALRPNASIPAGAYACVDPQPAARCRARWWLPAGQSVRVLEESGTAWVKIRWREAGGIKVHTGHVFRPALVPHADCDVALSPVAILAPTGQRHALRGLGPEVACALSPSGNELRFPRARMTTATDPGPSRRLATCVAATPPPPRCPNATITGYLHRRPVRIRPCLDCAGGVIAEEGTPICVLARAQNGFYQVKGPAALAGKSGFVNAGYVKLDKDAAPAGGTWTPVVPAGAVVTVYKEEALRTPVMDLTTGHDPRAAAEVAGQPNLWALYQPTGVLGYVRRAEVRRPW